jgi:hypothetical protein
MYNSWENIDDFYDFDDFDESLEDIDFSEAAGKSKDFKKSFSTVNRKIEKKAINKNARKKQPTTVVRKQPVLQRPVKRVETRKAVEKQVVKPVATKPQREQIKGKVVAPQKDKKAVKEITKKQGLPKRKEVAKPVQKPIAKKLATKEKVPVFKKAMIDSSQSKMKEVIIPDDRKVIIEGVNKFILSRKPEDKSIKNIGYYKGKKLKELVLIFNNTGPNPFTIELFNPSAPLDYLYNTSQNLNNKIEVAGGQVAYSDVLFNLLANPTLIPNCKFTFSGPSLSAQKAVPLSIIDRDIDGEEYIQPLNIDLTIDNMQVQGDVTFFDISAMLNRPYIPDGMDTIRYTVLPNMSVIMAFFYYQKSIKKAFFQEAREENPMRKL